MQTKLTVPIAAEDFDSAAVQIKTAIAAGAEMLELRIDYLKNISPDLVQKVIAEVRAASSKKIPIIVTCRSKSQGGVIEYGDHMRVAVLTAALQAGAEFVDFEYESFFAVENQEPLKRAISQSMKGRLILSAHNFKTKFDNITKLYRHILTLYPAAIPKLVYTANHINDCFEAFDLLRQTSGQRIIFCMGEHGSISRIIAKKMDCLVTFACAGEENATAPGQLTIEDFRDLYRCDSIDSDTELFGVIGSPVGHSLSPAIHNASFAKAGLNKLYLPFLVEGDSAEFDLFLKNLIARKWLNVRGLSVTIPHKKNALDFVDRKGGFVEPLAKKIGAVNTILINSDQNLKAYNTDYAGALDAVTTALKIERGGFKEMSVAVIGAGGVARAIVAGLRDAGAKVKIYNRTLKKAKHLAAEFDCSFASLEELADLEADLLINCTSLGMHPDTEVAPLPSELLKKDMAVFDTVYNPAETMLLRQAKQKRAKRINGPSMFVNQAAAQFKLFTGEDADAKLMQRTVDRYFKNK